MNVNVKNATIGINGNASKRNVFAVVTVSILQHTTNGEFLGDKMTIQLICQNLCNNLKDRVDFLKDIELSNKIEQLHRDMSEAHKELFIVRQRIMQRHYFDIEQFFKIEGYMRIKLRDYPNNRKRICGEDK